MVDMFWLIGAIIFVPVIGFIFITFLSLPSFIYFKLKKLILENREEESKLLKILILISPIILGGLNLLIIYSAFGKYIANWLDL
ncbi:MAG: hypothetical protein E6441_14595 [Clostridium sp.]|uniref:hypothetical protein n=1 Tax=Clostridium sp. TaxID=1506 RepID=UPI002902638A|nr:hypothetical protein [Clostridium sp.]MDU1078348.1 hypothetical protein [Clostridium sp.]MDU3678386.1 hypothetical protein [Clostridium sp.]MDU5210150.1 hypothetical protein [Clostridium sp.]MDU6762689.1 hypothetical protein [Clostridium sp.]